MAEPKTEDAGFPAVEYVQRIATFLEEVSAWCGEHGLAVERGAVTLNEELMARYDAPSLYIKKDGASLARIMPVGSKIVGAHGRVDLIGRVARHALLFYAGKIPAFSTQALAGGKTGVSPSTSMRSGVDRDGWYWIEALVRRPKRIDESLFLDLLTDVSDYEFY
ncbi:hypothetical protein NDK50_06645 [Paraburkholderia bryophila]|uniref:hypothetical protein n=1 Tax=Paraburkholderia bryophila TaxID=420952 RepID=UPI002349ED28|nr:hypothetical protein [Paraburkholderia bryophila]WCM21130.1 hypothetical protein NDK50_06645 [Paraburkholderia bryophila]